MRCRTTHGALIATRARRSCRWHGRGAQWAAVRCIGLLGANGIDWAVAAARCLDGRQDGRAVADLLQPAPARACASRRGHHHVIATKDALDVAASLGIGITANLEAALSETPSRAPGAGHDRLHLRQHRPAKGRASRHRADRLAGARPWRGDRGATAHDINLSVLPARSLARDHYRHLRAGPGRRAHAFRFRPGRKRRPRPARRFGSAPSSGRGRPRLCWCRNCSRPGLRSSQAGNKRAPDSLRFVAVGGARVSETLTARAWELGIPVHEGYGLTECCSVVALNRPGRRKAGNHGRAAARPRCPYRRRRGRGERAVGHGRLPARQACAKAVADRRSRQSRRGRLSIGRRTKGHSPRHRRPAGTSRRNGSKRC